VAVILGLTTKALECPFALSLGKAFLVYPRFGSSDCRCSGHLFRGRDLGLLANSSLDKPFPWAVGFLFGNTQLSLELWTTIGSISGLDE